MRRRNVVALVIVACGLGLACSRSRKGGALVAKGGDVEITTAELQAKLDEQSPAVRARYATRERKKEFLENLIRFELLSAEAKRQGLDKDPEVQVALQKIIVQRLVRKAFDDAGAAAASDDQVKKYYDQHLEEFVKPERVRVSQIFMRADRNAAERAARGAEARKLLARVKADEVKNPLAFSTAARESSDDLSSRASGGDLGFRTREELEASVSKEAAAAAFGLANAGDETGVIESDRGFHLLKLTGRQPGIHKTLDDVRPQIAARAAREGHAREFDAFVTRLRDSAKVQIVDAELDKVQASQPAAVQPAATTSATAPPPGKQ